MKKLYCLLAVCIFFARLAAGDLLFINAPVVNMHALPEKSQEVVSQAIYGTPVALIEKSGAWLKVATPDKYQGWVEEAKVLTRSESYPSTSTIGKVKNLFAHVYLVEDTTPHPPVMTLPFEASVEVASPQDSLDKRWIAVKLLDGSSVWIQKGDLAFNPKPISLNEMLALSIKFLGLPYTWAGTSSYGFDCSGYVQMLYRQMGISLPRDSKQQYASSLTVPVEKSALEPGDLVFFGPNGQKVTHVGLYIGQSQFIHSTVQDNPILQISSLSEPVWVEKYVGARRVLH